MEIFRELFLSGDRDQLLAVADAIERSLSDGWARDKAAEERVNAMAVGSNRPGYCFACDKRGPRPAALLFLTEKAPEIFYVANIVPQEHRQLSHGEYNAILEEFYSRFAQPCAERLGASAELTEANVDLEHWMTRGTAEKLRRFSAAANKSTGSAHPSDRERWLAFVVAAHQEGSTLGPSSLLRWLVEMDRWPPEVAERLAIEYEFSRELLTFAEGGRWSA